MSVVIRNISAIKYPAGLTFTGFPRSFWWQMVYEKNYIQPYLGQPGIADFLRAETEPWALRRKLRIKLR